MTKPCHATNAYCHIRKQYAPPEVKTVQVFSDRLLAEVDGDLSQVWTYVALHGLFQTQRAAHQGWCNVIPERPNLDLHARRVTTLPVRLAGRSSASPPTCTPEGPDKRSSPVPRTS